MLLPLLLVMIFPKLLFILFHSSVEPVLEFHKYCSFHLQDPISSHHDDARERCISHLVSVAFWLFFNFCVHQMLMCNGMYAIDLRQSVMFLEISLCIRKSSIKNKGEVQKCCSLQNWTRLSKAFVNFAIICIHMHKYVLICCLCSFRGINDCLVPVSPICVRLGHSRFCTTRASTKGESNGYASHTTPFPAISPGRTPHQWGWGEQVLNNTRNPGMWVVDPSPMMVDFTITLLSSYQLYRRKFPSKDEKDIKDLGTLGTG